MADLISILQDLGWLAGPGATGAESLLGFGADGSPAVMPLQALRKPQMSRPDPALLPHIRAALAKVRCGQGSAYINFVGHSGVVGQGAGGPTPSGVASNTANAQQYSQGAGLKRALIAKGLPCRNSSWWGTAGLAQSGSAQSASCLTAYDPRITAPGYQVFAPGTEQVNSLCGLMLNDNGTEGPFSFLPVENWDTATVYEAVTPTSAPTKFDVGGATLLTNPQSSATTIRKTIVGLAQGVTAGVQTLNARATNTLDWFPVGMEMTLSTASSVYVRNMGFSGAVSAQFSDTSIAYSALPMLQAVGGDLTIIELMRNDQEQNVPVATWMANMSTIITAAQGFGDVILIHDHRPKTNSWNYNNDAAFTAGYYALAAQFNCPLLDIPARIPDAQSAALNYFCPDGIHYLGFGWQDIADFIGDFVASL